MTRDETRAPTDLTAGVTPTEQQAPLGGPEAMAGVDPLEAFDANARGAFAAVADRLIPAAHGMPSAAEVVDDDRLRFVLRARPDLVEPLASALRPDLGDDPDARLAALEQEAPALAALQLVIVAGYYTDDRVKRLIGYSGQLALTFDPWEHPDYIKEGLIDAVIARGPVWRDPATGQRAVTTGPAPDYTSVFRPDARREGGEDGPDRS